MSVQGLHFGYQNIIPGSGNFSLILNIKAPQSTSGFRKLFLINKQLSAESLTDFVQFKSDGVDLQIRFKNSTVDTTITVDRFARLNYVLLDFDGANVRVWNSDYMTYQTVAFNLRFTINNYIWMTHGPIVLGDSTQSQSELFYALIWSGLLDTNLVSLIHNGVHPLEIGYKLPDILFFREYPLSVVNDYITSIGHPNTLIGSTVASTLGFSSNQYGSHHLTQNQSRGYSFALYDSLIFPDDITYVLNDTYNVYSLFTFNEELFRGNQYEIDFVDTLELVEGVGHGDILVTMLQNVIMDSDLVKALEVTIPISNDFFFRQILKSWDGTISTSVSFTTTVLSSINKFEWDQNLTFSQILEHNWKLNELIQLLYFDQEIGVPEYAMNEVGNDTQSLNVVQTITCGKEATRPGSHVLKVSESIQCYKVQPAVDYGQ